MHLDDGLRLAVTELKGGNQLIARVFRTGGSANQPNDFIQIIERLLEPEQDVLALTGFAQFEIGTAAHHVGAVLNEVFDGFDQPQLARLAVHD